MKHILLLLGIFIAFSFTALAQVKVVAPITPNANADTYPTHYDSLGSGGYMTVADTNGRNAIPADRRKQNMLVGVADIDKLYWLKDGLSNSNWVEVAGGGGISGADTPSRVYFNYNPSIKIGVNIWRNSDDSNKYYTDYNWSKTSDYIRAKNSKKVYVDPINGIDAPGRGDSLLPYKTGAYAYDTALAGEIVFKAPGIYDYSSGFAGKNITRDLILGSYGTGRAILTTRQNYFAFTLSAGKSLTYEVTTTSQRLIVDTLNKDEYGNYRPLYRVASIAAVETTPNSFIYSGGKLYISTFNGRAPDSAIIVLAPLNHLISQTTTCAVSLENIEIWGGLNRVSYIVGDSSSMRYFSAYNTAFKYGVDDGSAIRGNVLASYAYCNSAYTNDGYDYQQATNGSNIYHPLFIEYRCSGNYNLDFTSTTYGVASNGSTAHHATKGIRVSGSYNKNNGRNVADIQNCIIANIGCSADSSLSTVDSSRVGFSIGGPNDAVLTNKSYANFIECRTKGNRRSFEVNNTATAELYSFKTSENDSLIQGNVIRLKKRKLELVSNDTLGESNIFGTISNVSVTSSTLSSSVVNPSTTPQITFNLPNVVTAGSGNNITYDQYGRVTGSTTESYASNASLLAFAASVPTVVYDFITGNFIINSFDGSARDTAYIGRDTSSTNELQTLSFDSGTRNLTLSPGGGTVTIPAGGGGGGGATDLGNFKTGNNVTITSSTGASTTFTIADPDSLSNNEIARLSVTRYGNKYQIIDSTTGRTIEFYDDSTTYVKYSDSNNVFPTITYLWRNAIMQGGDTRGVNDTLGTNDNNNLVFKTNNTFRGMFSNSGVFLLGTSSSTPVGGALLQVNGDVRILTPGTSAIFANMYRNYSSMNNASLTLSDNGALITRNTTGTNRALIVNQINAASTGDVLAAQFNSADVFTVKTTGAIQTTIPGGTGSAATMKFGAVQTGTGGALYMKVEINGTSYFVPVFTTLP